MDQHSKSEILRSYRKRYQQSSKKEKMAIIDAIIDLTDYNRKYVIRALNNDIQIPKRINRTRSSRYARLYETLRFIWAASNFLCGKRLKPFLPDLIMSLKRNQEITTNEQDELLLLDISAASIDRILAPARKSGVGKGRSTTKPGTLLKHQIPVRTFADWDEDKPGFLQVDLVAHCGESTRGEYVNSLDMTDVCTGWTVTTAFMGKSERFCVAAIEEITPLFPFDILGIDSDNGSEFINFHLVKYCNEHKITFTRGRPYKKNDSCYVEQKNWDVIRKMIGYGRYETEAQLRVIKRIHALLAFYQNYFQPSQKLISKTRVGARVSKKYDVAKTPAQRMLARDDTPEDIKARIKDTFEQLNPVALLRNINDLVEALYELGFRLHLS
jgi:hypothetical protein